MDTQLINNDTLRNILREHKLTYKDVAELLTSEYGNTSVRTVEAWGINRRVMPSLKLELLIKKLKKPLITLSND